jgi:hypothetical protein
VVATTVAAFIVPVKTSRAVAGLAVPMPTFAPLPRMTEFEADADAL